MQVPAGEMFMPCVGHGIVMTQLNDLAHHVLEDWNQIAIPFMAYAAQIENSPDKDDIWRTLLKIRWPWAIVRTEDVQAERLVPTHFYQFKISPPQDHRMVSAMIGGMASILRLYSDRHIIAVWDDQRCGYGYKHEGKDDVSIRELS